MSKETKNSEYSPDNPSETNDLAMKTSVSKYGKPRDSVVNSESGKNILDGKPGELNYAGGIKKYEGGKK